MFTPLEILLKQKTQFCVWEPDLRVQPLHQLEHKNPVISQCDYSISNSPDHHGPAAENGDLV